MKRFIGLLLAGVGVVGTCWGGFCCLSGSSEAMMHPVPISAMYGGMVGVACLTIGLVWMRD